MLLTTRRNCTIGQNRINNNHQGCEKKGNNYAIFWGGTRGSATFSILKMKQTSLQKIHKVTNNEIATLI
jgi:hypothetical protein